MLIGSDDVRARLGCSGMLRDALGCSGMLQGVTLPPGGWFESPRMAGILETNRISPGQPVRLGFSRILQDSTGFSPS